MVYYTIINESDDYNDLGFKLKTLKEAKERLKEIKRFDEEQGNPFNDTYKIKKIKY